MGGGRFVGVRMAGTDWGWLGCGRGGVMGRQGEAAQGVASRLGQPLPEYDTADSVDRRWHLASGIWHLACGVHV